MRIRHNNGRSAFTLVEMLVATALVMFIMLILSEAFVAGLEAFRTLKAIGDMEERLRAATTAIRGDLGYDHFDGKRRLSDPMFWNTGTREGFVNVTQGFFPTTSPNTIAAPGPGQTITVNPNALSPGNPMTNGYTWTIQPNSILSITDAAGGSEEVLVLTTPTATTFTANFAAAHPGPLTIRVIGQLEGVDADGILSRRATDQILHLAVKQRGNRQENFFTAHLPWNSPFFPVLLNPGPPPPTVPNPNYTPTTFFDQAIDGRYQDQVSSPPGPTGYKTQWAEVAYFLWPNGAPPAGGTTPLYALYRAEFKVAPDNRYVNGWVYPGAPPPILVNPTGDPRGGWVVDGYQEMCARSGSTTVGGVTYNNYYFPSPSSLASTRTTASGGTAPDRTFTYFYDPMDGRVVPPATGVLWPFDPNHPEIWSATLIATDVVSFDVQILSPQLGPTDFSDVPTGVFDTVTPQPYTVNAIKITLRVWDLKTHQTRQVSIIQDM